MGAVTTSLGEQAQSIFDELGYTVSRTGSELRAEYKWRVVQISVFDDDEVPPDSGSLRCFVTHAETVRSAAERLADFDINYDWAVIGIDDDGDYEVIHGENRATL